MATFFSGTDTNTLSLEGNDINHFLSLIVNNEGTYTARITRKVTKVLNSFVHTETTENSYYHTYKDEMVSLCNGKFTINDDKVETKEEFIEWFPMIINKESTETFAELDKRIDFINNTKFTKNLKYGYQPINTSSFSTNTPSFPKETQTSLFGDDEYRYDPYWEYVDKYEDKSSSITESTDNSVVPSDIIISLACQIVTCNLFIKDTNKSYSSLLSYVQKVDSLYENRFGKNLEDGDTKLRIKFIIGSIIEALLMYDDNSEFEKEFYENLTVEDENNGIELSSIYANELITLFESIKPKNCIILDFIIEELHNYLF